MSTWNDEFIYDFSAPQLVKFVFQWSTHRIFVFYFFKCPTMKKRTNAIKTVLNWIRHLHASVHKMNKLFMFDWENIAFEKIGHTLAHIHQFGWILSHPISHWNQLKCRIYSHTCSNNAVSRWVILMAVGNHLNVPICMHYTAICNFIAKTGLIGDGSNGKSHKMYTLLSRFFFKNSFSLFSRDIC